MNSKDKALIKKIIREELTRAIEIVGTKVVKLIKKNIRSGAYNFEPLSTLSSTGKKTDSYAYRKKRDVGFTKPILVRSKAMLNSLNYKVKRLKGEYFLEIFSLTPKGGKESLIEIHAKGNPKNNLPSRDAIGLKSTIPGIKNLLLKEQEKASRKIGIRFKKEGFEIK